MKTVPPILRMRRDLVQAIIQFANKTQGGAWSLVNCTETDRCTMLELESDYPIRDFESTGGEPPAAVRRFRIMVEPVITPAQLVTAATGDVPPLVPDPLLFGKNIMLPSRQDPRTDPNEYCRHCDVFIGYGALGVVNQPEGKDEEWLAGHCWLCGRSKEEIIAAERERGQ